MSGSRDDEAMELQRQEIREKQYDRDVGLGNQYRLECIKHCITLATGALVFTITFKKDYLTAPSRSIFADGFATVGWLFLIVSLATGVWHMQCWEHYYFGWILEPAGRDDERKKLTRLWHRRARAARIGQYSSLTIGLLCIALYVICGLWLPTATIQKQ